MRTTATAPALPVIELLKRTGWEVHWDYQESPESGVLFKNREYLRGRVDGILDVLGIDPKCVCCASGFTGTVKRLPKGQAEALHAALTRLLVPLVTNEHARLARLHPPLHPLLDAANI